MRNPIDEGIFIPDFSFAGNQSKFYTKNIKRLTDKDLDVTGKKDCSSIIQNAIDNFDEVILPNGIIRVDIQSDKDYSIGIIKKSIKLCGSEDTKLYCSTTNMRKKSIIQIGEQNKDFDGQSVTSVKVLEDIKCPTNEILVNNPVEFKIGDWIIIRADWTSKFIEEHSMTRYWKPSKIYGQSVWRKIVGINGNKILIDIPISINMKIRDNLRVYKCEPKTQNVLIENLYLGNKQSPWSSGMGAKDYNDKNKNAYKIHASCLIKIIDSANCEINNVKSFDFGNSKKIHMLSNGMLIRKCRSISIKNCSFDFPEYKGGGGNGYGFIIQSGDCLFENCSSKKSRHALAFRSGNTNGNVVTGFLSDRCGFPVDFHMHLSACNLIECSKIIDGYFEAKNRGAYGSPGRMHGLGTENSVFWNIEGERKNTNSTFVIWSKQHGTGIVCGTRGSPCKVKASIEGKYPKDYVSYVGNAENLIPQSLYKYQVESKKG